jgi:serine/threonine protein kinase, bacterial
VTQPVPLAPGIEPYPGYSLLRLLGRGGWGEVWKARQPKGQHVALKFLPCDSQLAAAQEIRALQTIRQLRHRHLIRIEQIWCWSGFVVIEMELAEGSMLDLLDVYYREFGAGIVAEHLCHFLMQAADALDFLNTRQHLLHGQRMAVRHCDIKPSNLLVLEGQVKVADFSLAALATSPMWYHASVGTLNYAAPEIFQGRLSDRTDQYALAVSYCELRTGQLPFHDTPTTFDKNYVRPEPDLTPLDACERPVLARALHAVPQDRWSSCREMMERLTYAVGRAGGSPHKKNSKAEMRTNQVPGVRGQGSNQVSGVRGQGSGKKQTLPP